MTIQAINKNIFIIAGSLIAVELWLFSSFHGCVSTLMGSFLITFYWYSADGLASMTSSQLEVKHYDAVTDHFRFENGFKVAGTWIGGLVCGSCRTSNTFRFVFLISPANEMKKLSCSFISNYILLHSLWTLQISIRLVLAYLLFWMNYIHIHPLRITSILLDSVDYSSPTIRNGQCIYYITPRYYTIHF